MLDKSVKFMNIIMKMDIEKAETVSDPTLPNGFNFRLYQPNDDKHWSRIETSVLEFDTELDARDFFQKAYIPYEIELRKRCLFVLNPDGLPIATANAWYTNSELGHQVSLHWVAVCPEYQGLGIGKAIVQEALNLFQVLEPNCSIWLHTQTWSHIAIRLYHSLGFNLVKEEKLENINTRSGHLKIYPNDFPEYIETLRNVMNNEIIEELVNTAV